MKKEIIMDRLAEKELNLFDLKTQIKFVSLTRELEKYGRLKYPYARKLLSGLYELRVKNKGIFRGIYVYFSKKEILILHFFMKKTQKTPNKNIKIAQKRLKHYETR